MKFSVFLLGQALKLASKYKKKSINLGICQDEQNFPDLGRMKDKFLLLKLLRRLRSKFPIIVKLQT